MKVAVCRYSLNLQTEADSSVGGGRLTRACIEAIRELGHEPVIVGKAGKQTQNWLQLNEIDYTPAANSIGHCRAAVVLTGPRNSLYGDSLRRTYQLLATLKSKSRAAYAQWDVALPFAFRPEHDGGLSKHGHTWAKISHLRWTLFTQLTEQATRNKGGKPVAYDTTPFQHSRCFFELEEYDGAKTLPSDPKPQPAFAYFGSDRPGRLREFKRWFLAPDAPPVHVFGRWSDASKKECAAPNVTFGAHVSEGSVRQLLNGYLATLYIADPAYVKHDFVAQRFFENAMAGVPTLYSDRLQPSIAAVVPSELKLQPGQLGAWFEMLKGQTAAERQYLVDCNVAAVDALSRASAPNRLLARMGEFLG